MAADLAAAIPDRISRGYLRHEWLPALPPEWRPMAVETWQRKWSGPGLEGDKRRRANRAVRGLVEADQGGPLRLSATDQELCDLAAARAERFQRMPITAVDPDNVSGAQTPEGAAARIKCARWWRRQLRTAHGRRVEAAGISAGLVRADAQQYATDTTVRRRAEQRSRNRRMLEELLAVSEHGDEYTLAELSDLSTSNPVLRRNELMTRMAGFEWLARESGHAALFLTMTAPSRYHRHRTRRHGRGRRIVDNPKWDGSTPREAQAYLSSTWARIRAAFRRHGLQPYGFRIAEPQHDGTPHWHLLLFVDDAPVSVREGRGKRARWRETTTADLLTAIMRDHATRDTPDEFSDPSVRCDVRRIDWNRGSATGYVAKYVSKNIDGACLDPNDPAAVQADAFGRDPAALATRVDAWASTWGIRQFQQIGGPAVTVWRELRRIDGEESGGVELARACADAGQWGPFCLAMQRAAVRAFYLQDVREEMDPATGEVGGVALNAYGEEPAGRVIGVEDDTGRVIVTRDRWSVGGAPSHSAAPQGRAGGGAAAAPWSPVNNCTRTDPGAEGVRAPPPRGGESPPPGGRYQ